MPGQEPVFTALELAPKAASIPLPSATLEECRHGPLIVLAQPHSPENLRILSIPET